MNHKATTMNMRNYSRAILVVLLLLPPVYGEVITLGRYPAKILPEQEGALTFNASGLVSDLLIAENSRAEKGQVVAVMDKEREGAGLRQRICAESGWRGAEGCTAGYSRAHYFVEERAGDFGAPSPD